MVVEVHLERTEAMHRVDTRILTAEDIESPRGSGEFLAWVDAKSRELRSPVMREFTRSGTGLAKKFFEESRPLALFIDKEFHGRSDIQVSPRLGNQNFDAEIASPDYTLRVEITYAKDGYDESLRLEVLSKEGAVNWLAPIRKVSGLRHSPDRSIDIPDDPDDERNVAVRHDKTVEKHLNLVRERVAGKANRQYGSHYILLVVVDDYVAFRKIRDIEKLDGLVYKELLTRPLDFQRIVFIGANGGLHRSYALEKSGEGHTMYPRNFSELKDTVIVK